VHAGPADAIYVSGYGLLHPSNQAALLGWLDRLDDGNAVFFDPGPLVHLIPAEVLDPVLRRADWWTCNAREAASLTGQHDPLAAARGQNLRPRGKGLRAGGGSGPGGDGGGEESPDLKRKKPEPPPPKFTVDVFRGGKHTQEVFR